MLKLLRSPNSTGEYCTLSVKNIEFIIKFDDYIDSLSLKVKTLDREYGYEIHGNWIERKAPDNKKTRRKYR